MNSNTFLFLLLMAGLLAACSPDQSTTTQTDDPQTLGTASTEMNMDTPSQILPPLEKVQVAFKDFEVEASQQSTLELDNGTEIIVPAGALVDANQQAITGKVDVSYREFHDVADVLLSGISMAYDSAGESHILQTAGMMEIRASQNGQPVFIANGKEVAVNMTSYREDNGYNLYQFEEGANNWSFIRTSQAEMVPSSTESVATDATLNTAIAEDIQLAKQELPVEPFQPKRLAPDAIPFDFDVDYSRFPALASYKDLTWQYAQLEEEGCVNPETNEWVFGEVWSSATVQEHPRKKGIFYFTLRSAKKEARILVTPVVEEDNYAQTMAVFDQLQKEQEARRQRILAARERMRRRAEAAENDARINRAFAINSFGIYNIDRIWSQPQVYVQADFQFDQFSEQVIAEDLEQVYLIMPDDNAVIPVPRYKWKKFRYAPATANIVMAILPDNKIAIFGKEDFVSQKPSGDFVFQMKETEKTVNSPDDLRQVLKGA